MESKCMVQLIQCALQLGKVANLKSALYQQLPFIPNNVLVVSVEVVLAWR